MSFSDRLKLIIGDESLRSFAQKTNVSEGTLRAYLSGKSEPTMQNLIALSSIGSVSIDWLATGEGPMRPGGKEKEEKLKPHDEHADFYYIPLYDVRASAGHGAWNDSEHVIDTLAFKRQWIRQELGAQPEQLCLICITGESMEPTLHAGDVILIDKSIKEVNTDGIYVLMLDGSLLTKRCQRLPGKKIRVSSDNPAYEPFILDDNINSPEQHLVGRVVWAGRKF